MNTIRIIVGDREYFLSSRQDMDAARASAVEAVRAGGGFVDVVDVSGREIGMLVSAGMELRFEVTTVADDAGASEPSPRTIAYDFDY
jgi:hypothetical protein